MRTPVKLLCVTPKTGIARRYVDRKPVDKASISDCPPEEVLQELEYFRLNGLPNDEGGNAA